MTKNEELAFIKDFQEELHNNGIESEMLYGTFIVPYGGNYELVFHKKPGFRVAIYDIHEEDVKDIQISFPIAPWRCFQKTRSRSNGAVSILNPAAYKEATQKIKELLESDIDFNADIICCSLDDMYER